MMGLILQLLFRENTRCLRAVSSTLGAYDCDPALHSSHQTQRYYNEYLAAKNIPSSPYGTKNMEMPYICLMRKMLLPVSSRLV